MTAAPSLTDCGAAERLARVIRISGDGHEKAILEGRPFGDLRIWDIPLSSSRAPEKHQEIPGAGAVNPPANAPESFGALPQDPGPNLPANAPTNAPRSEPQMPQTSGDQMPQSLGLANAPNTPGLIDANTEFARPAGWSKLWRVERNGKYFKYVLRFVKGKVTRPGGRITAKAEKILKKRPGKGRHQASRVEASRLRSRAEHLADRIRSSPDGGGPSQGREAGASPLCEHSPQDSNRDLGGDNLSRSGVSGLDNGDNLSSLRDPAWLM